MRVPFYAGKVSFFLFHERNFNVFMMSKTFRSNKTIFLMDYKSDINVSSPRKWRLRHDMKNNQKTTEETSANEMNVVRTHLSKRPKTNYSRVPF